MRVQSLGCVFKEWGRSHHFLGGCLWFPNSKTLQTTYLWVAFDLISLPNSNVTRGIRWFPFLTVTSNPVNRYSRNWHLVQPPFFPFQHQVSSFVPWVPTTGIPFFPLGVQSGFYRGVPFLFLGCFSLECPKRVLQGVPIFVPWVFFP